MGNKGTLITQFSDLHLTRTNIGSRSEPKLFGKLIGMNAAFEKLAHGPAAQQSDYLLFTGDITDTGHRGEWRHFWRTLSKAKLKEKSLIIPGNHDMCCLGARLPKSEKKLVTEEFKKFQAGLAMGKVPLAKYPGGIQLNSCNPGETLYSG